jgi:hypothetical protein
MKVITVATHPDRYYDSMLDSAKKNDINITILGMGEKWQGFGWKFTKMVEHLEKININEIVMFIDAYDVIFLDNVKKIEEKFLEIKSKNNFKILVGVDLIPNNILHKYAYNKIFSSNPHKINSGVYIGYAKDIYSVLLNIKKYNDMNKMDDQKMFINEHNKDNSIFYIDKKNEIILNIFGNFIDGKPDFEYFDFDLIKDNNNIKLFNRKYNTSPMILHGPGNANLDDIILKYNYKLTKKNDESRLKYMFTTIKNYYKYFTMEIFMLIIVIILIIIYIINKKKLNKNIV